MHKSLKRLVGVASGLGVLSPSAIGQTCGPEWTATGPGLHPSWVSRMDCLAAFDDGTGLALYGAGYNFPEGSAFKWTGVRWTPLQVQGMVHTLTGISSGAARGLYFGGYHISAPGAADSMIIRFDGSQYSVPGGGVSGEVRCSTAFPGPNGPKLVVGGLFLAAGESAARYIAQWDGTTWSALGDGMGPSESHVVSVAALPTGDGNHLIAGGTFYPMGTWTPNGIAEWNGSVWTGLGSGFTSDFVNASVQVPHLFGRDILVGGWFDNAGGVPCRNLARWNGSEWTPIGNGVGSGTQDRVSALASFDDGSGEALFVGGYFSSVGLGQPALRIAKWNGTWSPLSSGLTGGFDGAPGAMVPFEDANGLSLFVAGDIETAGGIPSPHVARWGMRPCLANCDGSRGSGGCPTLSANDFVCFQNRFVAGDYRANCDGSTTPPVLNVNDFLCFLDHFAAGCS